MTKPRLSLVVIMALLLSVIGTVVLAADQSQPGYGIDIEFVRDAEAGTYVCTAVVTNLDTGEPLFSPRITGKLGEKATARGSHDNSETVLTVTVDEYMASYELIVSRGGMVVSRQTALVKG